MAHNVFFVFSLPPAGVSDEEFSQWYERHAEQIVEVPGFLAARRYWLEPAVSGRPPTIYRHLSLYVLEGDSAGPLAELERRVGTGAVTLEDWFGDIRFASFDGEALEESEVELPDHAYLVFSTPPERIPLPEYLEWYGVHARENLTADGFDQAWRFRLTPATVDPEAPARAVHAAFYEVHDELPALRTALAEARDAGRVHFPDWFGEIEFSSVDCAAISPRKAAVAAG